MSLISTNPKQVMQVREKGFVWCKGPTGPFQPLPIPVLTLLYCTVGLLLYIACYSCSQRRSNYIEQDAEWTTRELRQMQRQLIQSVWAESRASTLYSSIAYRHDFLSILTGSAVCRYIVATIPSSSILCLILP